MEGKQICEELDIIKAQFLLKAKEATSRIRWNLKSSVHLLKSPVPLFYWYLQSRPIPVMPIRAQYIYLVYLFLQSRMYKVRTYNKYIANRPRAPTAICLDLYKFPLKIPQLIRICTNERDIRIKQILKANYILLQ